MISFTFKEFGVLIKGTYANKTFFAFVDKLINQKAVVINALKAFTLTLTLILALAIKELAK